MSANPKASWNRVKPVSGSFISVKNCFVHGWAINSEFPDRPVQVEIELDSSVASSLTADANDSVVAEVLGSNSAHGFSATLPNCKTSGQQRITLYGMNDAVRQQLQVATLTNGNL